MYKHRTRATKTSTEHYTAPKGLHLKIIHPCVTPSLSKPENTCKSHPPTISIRQYVFNVDIERHTSELKLRDSPYCILATQTYNLLTSQKDHKTNMSRTLIMLTLTMDRGRISASDNWPACSSTRVAVLAGSSTSSLEISISSRVPTSLDAPSPTEALVEILICKAVHHSVNKLRPLIKFPVRKKPKSI
jgi:hypothetical protein